MYSLFKKFLVSEKLAWPAVSTSFNFPNGLNSFCYCGVRVSVITNPVVPYFQHGKTVSERARGRLARCRLHSTDSTSRFHYLLSLPCFFFSYLVFFSSSLLMFYCHVFGITFFFLFSCFFSFSFLFFIYFSDDSRKPN